VFYFVCVLSVSGVEVRSGGFAQIEDTDVTGCGSQGLTAHAHALGYVVRRSMLSLCFYFLLLKGG